MSYLLHAFGKTFENLQDYFLNNKDLELSLSPYISIVSIMNESCYENSTLVYQCQKNNIEIYNDNSLYKTTEWNNLMKIQGILNIIDSINTEYILFLDGKDTVILKDIDESFIEKFKTFNADIVFNYHSFPFPKCVEGEKLHYINAGVCFGRKDALKKFYTECWRRCQEGDVYISKVTGKISEQYCVCKVATYIDLHIDVDKKGILFININHLTEN